MTSVKKIYIDSRFGKGTASRFSIELDQTVETAPDTVCYVTNFSAPVSFPTITAGLNDKVYILEENDRVGYYALGRIVTLPAAVYNASTLAQALQDALNGSGKTLSATYTVTYQGAQNHLLITTSDPDFQYFTLLDDQTLADPLFKRGYWTLTLHAPGPNYDPGNLMSANSLLGVSTTLFDLGRPALRSTWTSSTVDVRTVTALFLHSETLSDFRSIAPNGSRSVIRVIPVTQSWGSLIHDGHTGLSQDCIDVGQRSFKTIEFSIRDIYGSYVDFAGASVSFSLLFAQR